MSYQRRKVVVTGMGVISPLGLSVKESWGQLLLGNSGIERITQFDASHCSVQIAGEVKGFDPLKKIKPIFPQKGVQRDTLLNKKDFRRNGRFTHLALGAALEAYQQSQLDSFRGQIASERIGVHLGMGFGGLPEIETTYQAFLKKGFHKISPYFIPQVIANMAAGQISLFFHLKGPNLCTVTACASGSHSIGEAYRLIQQGSADVMFAGGTEATICPLGIGGFAALRALSRHNQEPQKASRPFDQKRDGFVMSEGAAVLILEAWEHAQKRGVPILAELVGYGVSGDAYHVTCPAPEGEGGYRCMKAALEDAGLAPKDVDYLNAHATSTRLGDVHELQAIARLFQEHRKKLHISATKSMTGHLLGAAGALEAIICVLTLLHHRIPPTINLENLDPQCADLGLQLTPNKMIEKPVHVAITNGFGFGGTNASLVFRAVS